MSYLNKVIQFTYDSGSNPGTEREIFVINETPSHITGIDVNSGLHRKFFVRKMRTIKILESTVLDIVPEDVNTISSLEHTFQENGYKTLLANKKFIATIIPDKNLNIAIFRKDGKTEFWKDGVCLNSFLGLSTDKILEKIRAIIDTY